MKIFNTEPLFIAIPFFEYFDSLPTKADQKALRRRILKDCKVPKDTWYTWKRRGDIPDQKARINITKILTELTGVEQNIDILFPTPINKRPCK